jgi:hypothetical protein
MAVKITEIQKSVINDKDTYKVIATTDRAGNPHVVFKGSVHVNDDGNIEYYEILESSQTNSNLVASIWFHQRVAFNFLDKEKNSIQIKGRPVKSITSGRYFEAVYKKLREGGRDIDLGAIWIIEPDEIKDETFINRVREDEEKYPILKHVDRLLKDEEDA